MADQTNWSHDVYRTRAAEHAPKTAAAIREAARELIAEGHSDHGAATILGLDVGALRRLIGQCVDCGS